MPCSIAKHISAYCFSDQKISHDSVNEHCDPDSVINPNRVWQGQPFTVFYIPERCRGKHPYAVYQIKRPYQVQFKGSTEIKRDYTCRRTRQTACGTLNTEITVKNTRYSESRKSNEQSVSRKKCGTRRKNCAYLAYSLFY